MVDPTQFQFHNPTVPRAYEDFLVPRLFSPCAEVLLDAAELRPGDVVLDIATGPGTVARGAAVRVGARGRVVGADVAAPMLEIARAKPAVAGAAPIEYIESPAAPLAAPSGAFDRVVCHQGLQFFPDRRAALMEMRRVLKPGGRVAIGVWEHLERNEVYASFHAALRETVSSSLADLVAAPCCFPDASVLAELMSEAGFSDVRVDTRSMLATFEGGVEQAASSFAATPAEPKVAALDQETQRKVRDALRRQFARLVSGNTVVTRATSNIAVGYA
jgi:ubiquinone/menaquinone biosynthesis C-methylase UbiE